MPLSLGNSDISRCSACVHYTGCQIWLALLLMNNELAAPGLDIIVPDISKACPMFPGLLEVSAQRYQKLWWIIPPSQLVQPDLGAVLRHANVHFLQLRYW